MTRKKTYIAIDIEAALIRGKQYIIEIGAVKLKPDNTTETFTQLIQPYRFTKLNYRIQQLTGITTEQLVDAPSFKYAIKQFKQWCGEDYILLTFGEFDRKVLEEELVRNYIKQHFLYPMIDFQQKYMIHHAMKEQPSLGRLMEELNLEVTTQHRALADADSLLRIFMKVNGDAMIESQKTNRFSLLLGSFKQYDEAFKLLLTTVEATILNDKVTIEQMTSHITMLDYHYEEVKKVLESGEEEISQVVRINPSKETKQFIEQYFLSLKDEILITRSGLKGLSRILRLHNCSAPKLEVMTLLNILKNEEASEAFRYNGEDVSAYEQKIKKLVKQNEKYIVEEFHKRALL